jgi:hypothetical protein
VEKNGDTNMHKARLGMLPAAGRAVLLLSNLGGSMGCQLTALKFGVLALLAGGNEVRACMRACVCVRGCLPVRACVWVRAFVCTCAAACARYTCTLVSFATHTV